MLSMDNEMDQIRALVGDIDAEQMRFVDSFVGEKMALFIPSIGPCLYAITPDHSHPAYSFILNFDSGTRVVVGERVIETEPGTVMAMDPGASHHELIEDQHGRYVAIFIDRQYFEQELTHYPDIDHLPFNFRAFAPAPELINLAKDFMAEADNRLPGRYQVLAACGLRICHSLIRSLQNFPLVVSESSDRVEIHKAIEYMHVHYERKLSVEDLASVAGFSPSHFNRVFRRETGKSPIDYLIGMRLEKVRKLLRSGTVRITDAALQCGFSSSSHLTSCFRQAYGTTPSEYLKSLK